MTWQSWVLMTAVGAMPARLYRNHLRHVQRSTAAGDPAEQKLRERSRISEIREDRSHHGAVYSALQRGKVQVAGGVRPKSPLHERKTVQGASFTTKALNRGFSASSRVPWFMRRSPAFGSPRSESGQRRGGS